MFFIERLGRICVRGNTLEARYIDKCFLPVRMRSLGNFAQRFQFFFRVKQAFIAARNIVIYFDAIDATLIRLTNNRLGARPGQRIRCNADLAQPRSRVSVVCATGSLRGRILGEGIMRESDRRRSANNDIR